MRSNACLGFQLAVLLGLAAVGSAAGGDPGVTRVPLVVDEPAPPRTVAWPITTGVPFPRGQLKSVENCRLVDDRGREQPLQARVAATWDERRQSIRWLTIDFVAEPGRRYALEFGPEVQRRQAASPLRIEQGEPLRVATGPLMAEFSSRNPAGLGRIRLDLDGDGRVDPEEWVAAGGEGGEHYYLDQQGQRFTSGRDGQERRITVESVGPVRACVRVDGFYTGPDRRRLVEYRTRYHFFAGLGLIKVIDEFRIVGSTRDVRWKDIGFTLQLPPRPGDRSVAVDVSGEPGNQVLVVKPGPDFRSLSSYQAVYRHYGNPECVGGVVEKGPELEKRHRQAERVGEWMQVRDGRSAVTGSLRWFWQQFPKEWEAAPEALTLHLWSPRGGELDFGVPGIQRFFGPEGTRYLLDWPGARNPRSPIDRFFYFAGRPTMERNAADGQGVRKHHEFYLHFGPARDAERGQEYGRLAGLPPLALASGQWNCSTGVFGPLAARPSDSPEEAIVDRLFDLGRQAQDTFGDYGWWLFGAGPHYSYQWDAEQQRHYADPRRFEYHTYHKETQLWWCYLRSGERKFWDWALPSENHWVDVAVAHVPLSFESAWRGGEPLRRTLHWPRGDWAIDSTVHYLRHHDTAEAWLRGQSQFWATYHRTLETTTLAYYLTGDERFEEVLGYWRAYWADLAGKTSASPDLRPWHREQAWFRPGKGDNSPRTWAEMIRDYAPFTSGSRHQMTLFFNLATLREHTWDPTMGQVLREYADAFLDPNHPIGVWRSQENRLPAHAEAPTLAHYWVPALWKYERVTGDPRMKEVLRRYFEACWTADPFREDVGIYSNLHLGYAYWFTRDPKHLGPALKELERLRPNGEPLARPQDLGQRIYNPYAPAQSFAAVPRLLWAVQEARRQGVPIPDPPPALPQRTLAAWHKQAKVPIEATLWGFDRVLEIIGPDGQPCSTAQVRTEQYASALQPFDRTMPRFEVYLHFLVLPAEAPAGFYFLRPRLELGVVKLRGSESLLHNGAEPVAVHSGEPWLLSIGEEVKELRLESANPKALRVLGPDGKPLMGKLETTALTVPVAPGICRIENTGTTTVWLRLANLPVEQCWLAHRENALRRLPEPARTAAGLRPPLTWRAEEEFVPGRFGRGLLIVPGRELRIPDRRTVDGPVESLLDERQGTIEFWVKRLWDERLTATPRVTFLTNGLVEAWNPWKLPVGDWAHVAVVWRPLKREPSRIVVHVYVDGLDLANYRSTWWEGYSSRPFELPKKGQWLKEFVSRAPPGTAFVLDELRMSSVARYADLDAEFGGQETFNPVRFTPPAQPFEADRQTLLLYRFDGDRKEAREPGGK